MHGTFLIKITVQKIDVILVVNRRIGVPPARIQEFLKTTIDHARHPLIVFYIRGSKR